MTPSLRLLLVLLVVVVVPGCSRDVPKPPAVGLNAPIPSACPKGEMVGKTMGLTGRLAISPFSETREGMRSCHYENDSGLGQGVNRVFLYLTNDPAFYVTERSRRTCLPTREGCRSEGSKSFRGRGTFSSDGDDWVSDYSHQTGEPSEADSFTSGELVAASIQAGLGCIVQTAYLTHDNSVMDDARRRQARGVKELCRQLASGQRTGTVVSQGHS